MRVQAPSPPETGIGPLLYLRGADASGMSLAALVVWPEGTSPPELQTAEGEIAPERLLNTAGFEAWRFEFRLSGAGAWYELAGERHEIAADATGDLRIAYVACNGQEEGDLARPEAERNVMWARLGELHRERPFAAMLQGGDQIYADEVVKAHSLSESWPEGVRSTLTQERYEELRDTLRETFFKRYLMLFGQSDVAWIFSRVPTLAMWDDHDICDGWGSLPEEATRSDVGRALFAAAREMFLLFQMGATEGDIPRLCADPTGDSLTARVDLPGAAVLLPDLRSERSRHRVMGARGWQALEATLERPAPRMLLMSSVPLLGPRLSIVESLMQITPWHEEYEDDLRDQWQSRAHRKEWIRMLRRVIALHEEGHPVTALSGEIHLATRATMATSAGPLHQLVASGISHPPPHRAYARALGAFARWGQSPVRHHPIRIRPLPGERSNYTAERNFLVIERQEEAWSARWFLEETGETPALPI